MEIIPAVLMLIFSIIAVLCFRYMLIYHSNKSSKFDTLITGIYVIPEDENDVEFIFRELFSYLQRNEIRCFKKIYIINKNKEKGMQYICKKMCNEYPIFEML